MPVSGQLSRWGGCHCPTSCLCLVWCSRAVSHLFWCRTTCYGSPRGSPGIALWERGEEGVSQAVLGGSRSHTGWWAGFGQRGPLASPSSLPLPTLALYQVGSQDREGDAGGTLLPVWVSWCLVGLTWTQPGAGATCSCSPCRGPSSRAGSRYPVFISSQGVSLSLSLAICPSEGRGALWLLHFVLFLLFWSQRVRSPFCVITPSSLILMLPPCFCPSADFISMLHSFMPRLLIKILNKIGSKIDSSGIPLVPSLQLDSLLSASTLSSSRSLSLPHITDFVLIFIFSFLTNDFPCGTISNALLKSRKIKFRTCPLFKKYLIKGGYQVTIYL